MDAPERKRLPPDFKKALQDVAGLSERDADIYILGLEKGVITSGMVAAELNMPQNTASDRLKQLAAKNFFLATPPQIKGGGEGTGIKYKVQSPKEVLGTKITSFKAFLSHLHFIDQFLEMQSADEPRSDDMWRIPPDLLVSHFGTRVRAARNSVKIVCNNCSWVDETTVIDALREARSAGKNVCVCATKVDDRVSMILRSAGVEIKEKKPDGLVFALIDDSLLYIVFKEGRLVTKYAATFTANEDLVSRHAKQFEALYPEGGGPV